MAEKELISDCKEGEIFHGLKVDELIGKNSKTFMFLNLNDNHYNIVDYTPGSEKIARYTEITIYASKLESLINIEKFDLDEDKRLKSKLADVYYAALNDESNVDIASIFKSAEIIINNSVNDIQETKYIKFISCNILHTSLFIILVACFYLIFKHISLMAAIGGSIGAMLSVIQRNKKTKQVHFSSRINMVLFSIISITLGSLSGFILYWASQANIVLGTMSGNTSAIFVFAVLAGTSERYFNSLLSKVEKTDIK